MFKEIRTRHNESGFTLIELLVVILIIGILAAVAIPVFLNQRQKANDTAVVSDLKNAAMMVEASVLKSGLYPGSIPADAKFSNGVTINFVNASFTSEEQAFNAKLGSAITNPNGTRNNFNVAMSGPFMNGDHALFYGPSSAEALKATYQADAGSNYNVTQYNGYMSQINNGMAIEFYWNGVGYQHFAGKPAGSTVMGVTMPSRKLWTIAPDKKFCLEGKHENGSKTLYYDSSKGGIVEACAP